MACLLYVPDTANMDYDKNCRFAPKTFFFITPSPSFLLADGLLVDPATSWAA
jgi:hypothetical protein